MATLKELRLRIASLKNTRKITSAMKMVSASKLKRAKDAVQKSQPYIDRLNEVLLRLYHSIESVENPLLEHREVSKERFIIFSSDRGLCGGFNNNLVKFFKSKISEDREAFDVCVAGKKAHDSLKKTDITIHKYYENAASSPDIHSAREIADDAIKDFLTRKADRVFLVFNYFVSSLTQRPTIVQLLPFEKPAEEDAEQNKRSTDYIFEPDCGSLLNDILPEHFNIQVLKALLNNAVGEHAARMSAMDSATNNASEYISSLTIKMNRARQAAITTELIEIISGAEAL